MKRYCLIVGVLGVTSTAFGLSAGCGDDTGGGSVRNSCAELNSCCGGSTTAGVGDVCRAGVSVENQQNCGEILTRAMREGWCSVSSQDGGVPGECNQAALCCDQVDDTAYTLHCEALEDLTDSTPVAEATSACQNALSGVRDEYSTRGTSAPAACNNP